MANPQINSEEVEGEHLERRYRNLCTWEKTKKQKKDKSLFWPAWPMSLTANVGQDVATGC